MSDTVSALRSVSTKPDQAQATNLDLKHFQKIEAGKLNVTLVTLVRIAEGFGETVASLFKPSRSRTKK
jgi:transcriptional regulator with XRE-family HTH domain